MAQFKGELWDDELTVTREAALRYLADGLRALLDNGMDPQRLLDFCSEIVAEQVTGKDVSIPPGGTVQ